MSAKQSNPNEQVFLMEDKDGFLVRVPESKLDAWTKAQDEQGNAPLSPAEQHLKAAILKRIYEKGKEVSNANNAKDQPNDKNTAYMLVKRYAARNGMTIRDYYIYCSKQSFMAEGADPQTAEIGAKNLAIAQLDDVSLAFRLVSTYASKNKMSIPEYLDFCKAQENKSAAQPKDTTEQKNDTQNKTDSHVRANAEVASVVPEISHSLNTGELYHLCPHCGLPSPVENHCCRCGYRLSPALPVYRLCPDCKRFIPQDQFKCECGYSFPAQEQLLHVCPACGVVTPREQRICDCGYNFDSESTTHNKKASKENKIHHKLTSFLTLTFHSPILRFLFRTLFLVGIIAAFLLVLVGLGILWELNEEFFTILYGAIALVGMNVIAYFSSFKWGMKKPWFFFASLFLSIIVVIAFFSIFSGSSADTAQSNTQNSPFAQSSGFKDWVEENGKGTATPAPTPSHSPLPTFSFPPRPQNGQEYFENAAIRERIAPLTIVTRGSNDYYVKLRYAASKVSCLEFYVRGGETVDIDVPLGTFELVYASGSTWYGKSYLFGPDTIYHRADDIFEFYDDGEYINGWTVELYLQSNGNLDTQIISADEF